jgi:hypothetical protein
MLMATGSTPPFAAPDFPAKFSQLATSTTPELYIPLNTNIQCGVLPAESEAHTPILSCRQRTAPRQNREKAKWRSEPIIGCVSSGVVELIIQTTIRLHAQAFRLCSPIDMNEGFLSF